MTQLSQLGKSWHLLPHKACWFGVHRAYTDPTLNRSRNKFSLLSAVPCTTVTQYTLSHTHIWSLEQLVPSFPNNSQHLLSSHPPTPQCIPTTCVNRCALLTLWDIDHPTWKYAVAISEMKTLRLRASKWLTCIHSLVNSWNNFSHPISQVHGLSSRLRINSILAISYTFKLWGKYVYFRNVVSFCFHHHHCLIKVL